MPVLFDGERIEQVGRVCMDQFMVEIRAGPNGAARRRVRARRSAGGESITMDEQAELAGTINYELACSFGMRLPRV